MSAPRTVGSLTDVEDRLTETARATMVRVARRILDGFEGTVEITVGKGGGVRFVRWTQTETGDTIREELG